MKEINVWFRNYMGHLSRIDFESFLASDLEALPLPSITKLVGFTDCDYIIDVDKVIYKIKKKRKPRLLKVQK